MTVVLRALRPGSLGVGQLGDDNAVAGQDDHGLRQEKADHDVLKLKHH